MNSLQVQCTCHSRILKYHQQYLHLIKNGIQHALNLDKEAPPFFFFFFFFFFDKYAKVALKIVSIHARISCHESRKVQMMACW